MIMVFRGTARTAGPQAGPRRSCPEQSPAPAATPARHGRGARGGTRNQQKNIMVRGTEPIRCQNRAPP
ncbi:hypothetical protein FRAAL2155 [Frankia alni ACN14a]|uniref:Uncharacterized protein n=1 Tax=Frankia alni (strain DSM 45986 / CECT 9034 / ACN14a) TaxID=326424 RepID=Q0RNT2_FRAAA|nr:hypothetical protein FRAAL2155 [Frankia alni ACN14a]